MDGSGAGAIYARNIVAEHSSNERMLVVHEVMGRNCGWLTAATAAKYHEWVGEQKYAGFGNDPRAWDVHAVFVPELSVDLTAEADRLRKQMDEVGAVNIFLSEGAGIDSIVEELIARGEEPERDPFGHVKIDTINPGQWFAKQFAEKVGANKVLVQKSGYFSRSAAANADDLRLIKGCVDLAVQSASRVSVASSATTRSRATGCAPSSSPGSRAASRSTPSRRGSANCWSPSVRARARRSPRATDQRRGAPPLDFPCSTTDVDATLAGSTALENRWGLYPPARKLGGPMDVIRFVLNVLWFVFAGFWLALGYALAGLLMFVLIITIPFGIASFRLAGFVLWPFGRTIVPQHDAGTPSLIGNVLWFVLAGLWIAIGHVVTGVTLCLTIVGIPFGWANIKLALVALAPLGKEVVPSDSPRALPVAWT